MNGSVDFLEANWPAPGGIRAGTTRRRGGASRAPFDSLNLGDQVGDDPQSVAANRAQLMEKLSLPSEPAWLQQVHGARVVDAATTEKLEADASMATATPAVCAVLTADCLPVLFCDRRARCWAAAHAGWRGLAAGILEATIARLPVPPDQLLAWLGPAIGPGAFEVGQDVFDEFVQRNRADATAFVPRNTQGKYLADIYQLAKARLQRAGVGNVYGGGLCTVSSPEQFYSYRRDGETGRMASLVWYEK